MVKIKYEPQEHCAAAYDGNRQVGVCQYEVHDNSWCIFHTYTDSSYGGQGIARKMVDLIASEAEASGTELNATCWYAKKILGL